MPPLIKKRLRPKTADIARDTDYLRLNRNRLNRVVQEKDGGDLVKVKSRWFGRGDIKKVWDKDTRIRKRVSVTDSEGNLVREITFNSQGERQSQFIKGQKPRKKFSQKTKKSK